MHDFVDDLNSCDIDSIFLRLRFKKMDFFNESEFAWRMCSEVFFPSQQVIWYTFEWGANLSTFL